MAKKNLNLDRETGLSDAISFTVDGKTYECVDLTDGVMDAISEIADDDELRPGEMLSRQLEEFTASEPGTFENLTFRQKSAAIDHIMESMTDPLGKKRRRSASRR